MINLLYFNATCNSKNLLQYPGLQTNLLQWEKSSKYKNYSLQNSLCSFVTQMILHTLRDKLYESLVSIQEVFKASVNC